MIYVSFIRPLGPPESPARRGAIRSTPTISAEERQWLDQLGGALEVVRAPSLAVADAIAAPSAPHATKTTLTGTTALRERRGCAMVRGGADTGGRP